LKQMACAALALLQLGGVATAADLIVYVVLDVRDGVVSTQRERVTTGIGPYAVDARSWTRASA
jgi:hypothetical protein